MKREHFSDIVTGTLVLCAVVLVGLVARRELRSNPPVSDAIMIADWQDYTRQEQRLGPENAPVTIVEFSDFQCPYCAVLARRIDSMQLATPGLIAVVFRHFPLADIHASALAAAIAAECAAIQKRFGPFQLMLYEHQDSIGVLPWAEFARRARVADTVGFNRCLSEPAATSRVAEDQAAGARLGVQATPTLLINGRLVNGLPEGPALAQLIRQASARKPAGQ